MSDVRVEGYAAVFNSEAVIGGVFRERIAPGAFARTIGRDDVRALFNHDPNLVLGRMANRTLTLSEDTRGLKFSVTLPGAGWAKDLAASIERGDVNECSFGFAAVVQEWDEGGALPLRTLREVKLFDVSAVTYPAYGETTCSIEKENERMAWNQRFGDLRIISPEEVLRDAVRRGEVRASALDRLDEQRMRPASLGFGKSSLAAKLARLDAADRAIKADMDAIDRRESQGRAADERDRLRAWLRGEIAVH